MDLLEMKHIKKEFGGLEVLKDISLRVKEGEIVSIIGPSGSGKSTLLRCATMLTEIDSGEITYMGKKTVWMENGKPTVPKKAELKEIQSYFGLVFQNFNLFPPLFGNEKYYRCSYPCTEKGKRGGLSGGKSAACENGAF